MRVGPRLTGGMGRLRDKQRRRSEDRFAERFTQQWVQVRERRVAVEPTIEAGPSNFSRAQVPWGIDLAAAWSWRFLVIAAPAAPLVELGERIGIRRRLGSILVVVGGLGLVSLLLTFVGQQVSQGASDLAEQVVSGIAEIRTWLKEGPLQASDSQISNFLGEAQERITTGNEQIVGQVTELSTAIGHIVAGFFIVLFASYLSLIH